MTQQHPITPPPELVQKWWEDTHGAFYEFEAITALAAQWGADRQLELVEAMRPKPQSLKEQALIVLDDASLGAAHENIIRRALEQLDD